MTTAATTTIKERPLFIHVKGGLIGAGGGNTNNNNEKADTDAEDTASASSSSKIKIPFDPDWINLLTVKLEDLQEEGNPYDLPTHLTAPTNFIEVYHYNNNDDDISLPNLGRAARNIVDSCFASTNSTTTTTKEKKTPSDGVLFRNLSSKIQTSKDFACFWNDGVLDNNNNNDNENINNNDGNPAAAEEEDGDGGSGGSCWQPMSYQPIGGERIKKDGIDLVTNFPSKIALHCHNEMSCNPNPAGRIAFYCLSAAKIGGETTLARNSDHTQTISKVLQYLIKKHGGILYKRQYYDETKVTKKEALRKQRKLKRISWQKKTGTNDPNKAIEYFINKMGFSNNNENFQEVYFEQDTGNLIVQNIHSGYNDFGDWYNVFHMGWFTLKDGTYFPPRIFDQCRIDEWKSVYAIKLQPGDWIVLNNRTVQHGRLPYVNGETQNETRTILTVYTE